MAYVQKRMYDEAISELQRAVSLTDGGSNFVTHLGHAYARAGKLEEARKVLAELEALAEHRYVSSYYLATINLGLGEVDQAFAWLERAYEERSGFLAFLRVEPLMDPLRADARFTDLLHRIGLTP
jgi:Flp pilus assembly protein TadD